MCVRYVGDILTSKDGQANLLGKKYIYISV